MRSIFRLRMPSIHRVFVALIIIFPVISIITCSTCFRQSHFDRIGESVEVGEILDDDVYHLPEVFVMNYGEMEKKFKIYIYPEEDEYMNYHTTIGKYASEGYFFRNIRESAFLTRDPHQAHLFFIPISLHKRHLKVSSDEDMSGIAKKYVERIIQTYPYFNRTLGADHFLLTCHDGHHNIDVAMVVKNSIRVVCSSTYSGDAARFIPHKDVSLPSVMQPFSEAAGRGNELSKRRILGYWAGVCNSETRKMLVNLWGRDDELDIQNTTAYMEGRMKKLYTSKFCICPLGSRITNSRITMAIHYGCVPVILEDHLELPFKDTVDWTKFSVILKEEDVYRLKGILKAKDHRSLYRNLIKVQRHFQWNAAAVKYDAFHMIMYDLWLRRHIVKY